MGLKLVVELKIVAEITESLDRRLYPDTPFNPHIREEIIDILNTILKIKRMGMKVKDHPTFSEDCEFYERIEKILTTIEQELPLRNVPELIPKSIKVIGDQGDVLVVY